MGLHGHIKTGGDGRIYKDGITVTPTELQQIIEPPQGFNGIKEVTVNPIPSQYKKLETVTNAAAGDLIENKTAYTSNGELLTGTIPVITGSDLNKEITTKNEQAIFRTGYYNVSPAARIASEEVRKIRANNIKYGISILGENGIFTKVSDGETGAVAAEVVAGRVCWVNGEKVEGTMANTGAVMGSISNVSDSIVVPQGYTSGGTIAINAAEQAKIITGNIRAGVNILGVNGKSSVVDTAGGNVAAGDVLAGKVAYANGVRVTGTLVNNGAVGGNISNVNDSVVIPAGYTSGGSVSIDLLEQYKIISNNIRAGVSILGVSGASDVISTAENQSPASANDIANGKVAFVNGQKITGAATGGSNDDKFITGDWENDTTYTNTTANKLRWGFPKDTTLSAVVQIEDYCMASNTPCENLSFPVASSVGQYAFYGNRYLKNITLNVATTIFQHAFDGCLNLMSVSAPSAVTIQSQGFKDCSNQLSSVSFPSATKADTSSFAGCKKLVRAEFPKLTTLGQSAFNNCLLLDTLIVGTESDTVCTLNNVNAFNGTPIASGTGYIYTKDSMVDSYKSTTNWQAYASQIRGISELV